MGCEATWWFCYKLGDVDSGFGEGVIAEASTVVASRHVAIGEGKLETSFGDAVWTRVVLPVLISMVSWEE